MTGTVGYIGLGAMGGAMAGRLADSDFDLQVFDLSADAVAGVVAKGAVAAESGAALAASCEALLDNLKCVDERQLIAKRSNT